MLSPAPEPDPSGSEVLGELSGGLPENLLKPPGALTGPDLVHRAPGRLSGGPPDPSPNTSDPAKACYHGTSDTREPLEATTAHQLL